MSDDFTLAELKALKDADSAIEAGPEVERRVLKAVRRRRVVGYSLRTGAGVAIGLGVVLTALNLRTRPSAPPTVAARPAAVESLPPLVAPTAVPAPVPVKIVKPAARTQSAPERSRSEVATDFFPLIDTPPPFERGELMRVVVPASTMRKVGLPVGEDHLDDPVQADILVGQEGLARAIRFVNYQQ